MSHNSVAIEIVPGKQGPLYEAKDGFQGELAIDKVVITEKGTVGDLPIVDLVLTGPDGKRYMACCTGRIINAVSAAVRGVNLRNHGVEEP